MRRLHLSLLLGAFVLIWAPASPAAATDCLVATPCPPQVPAPGEPPAEEPPPEEPSAPPTEEPPPAATPPPGSADDAGAARLLELLNDARGRAGVPPLSRRPDVDSVAVDHSGRMAAAGRIWHNDDYFTAESRARLGARTLGENVAFNGSVEDAHRRLMASPGHRRNILSPAFRIVGLGVVRGESSWFVTQNFVEPKAQAAAAPAPPPQRAAAAPAVADVAAASAAPVVISDAAPSTTPPPAPQTEVDRPVARLRRGLARALPPTEGSASPAPAPAVVAGAAVVAAAGILQRSRVAWR